MTWLAAAATAIAATPTASQTVERASKPIDLYALNKRYEIWRCYKSTVLMPPRILTRNNNKRTYTYYISIDRKWWADCMVACVWFVALFSTFMWNMM